MSEIPQNVTEADVGEVEKDRQKRWYQLVCAKRQVVSYITSIADGDAVRYKILEYRLKGFITKEISAIMELAESTVQYHLTELKKLGFKFRVPQQYCQQNNVSKSKLSFILAMDILVEAFKEEERTGKKIPVKNLAKRIGVSVQTTRKYIKELGGYKALFRLSNPRVAIMSISKTIEHLKSDQNE